MAERPFASWKNSYDTGVDLIDGQHKKLVQIMNELHAGLKNRSSKSKTDVFGKAVHEAVSYAREHFASEEEWMRGVGYSGLQRQKNQHSKFIQRLLEHCGKFDKSGSAKVALDFVHYLRYWLLWHIAVEDNKFRSVTNKGGGGRSAVRKTRPLPPKTSAASKDDEYI